LTVSSDGSGGGSRFLKGVNSPPSWQEPLRCHTPCSRCSHIYYSICAITHRVMKHSSCLICIASLGLGDESWKGERGSMLPRIYTFQEPQAASGAVCSDNQYLIPTLRITFPPFSTKSVHLSVKVHNNLAGNPQQFLGRGRARLL
jgi:hypothetical protein